MGNRSDSDSSMSGMPWFRLFSEARTDAKLRTLADDEHRVWFSLLCYAAEQSDRGSISAGDSFLLAIEVSGGDEELLGRTISKLIRLRILVETEDGSYLFANFIKRQYDKPSDRPDRVSERVRKHRAGARNDYNALPADSNADVTPCNAIDKSREEEIRVEESNPLDIPPSDPEPIADPPLTEAPKLEPIVPSGSEPTNGAVTVRQVKAVPKPRPHRLPDDFTITDDMWAIAAENGWQPDLVKFETDKFIDHYGGSGKPMVDWVATWRNWMRRVPNFAAAVRQTTTRGGISSIDDWAERKKAELRNGQVIETTGVVR